MKAGNRIVLDEAGSYIEDKQTSRKKIRSDNGAFKFELWVPKAAKSEKPAKEKTKKVSFKQSDGDDMDVGEARDGDEDDGDAALEMVFIGQV